MSKSDSTSELLRLLIVIQNSTDNMTVSLYTDFLEEIADKLDLLDKAFEFLIQHRKSIDLSNNQIVKEYFDLVEEYTNESTEEK
jgi:isoleucyl-tRNA synthetase